MTGAGSGNGKLSDTRPPCGDVSTASAPVPPGDNDTADGVAAGSYRPPAARRNVALTGTHLPSCSTRTGSTDEVTSNLPSGSATVVDVCVVSELTATGCPVRFARTPAASNGLSAAGSAAAAPAAGADAEVDNGAASAIPAMPASSTPATNAIPVSRGPSERRIPANIPTLLSFWRLCAAPFRVHPPPSPSPITSDTAYGARTASISPLATAAGSRTPVVKARAVIAAL